MPRLLLVEDNEGVARSLARALSRPPLSCEAAGSVAEARTLLDSASFDAVIVDADLGEDAGQDLIVEVRRRFPEVITVLVSGLDRELLEEEATRCGAHHALMKPFTLDALRDALSRP